MAAATIEIFKRATELNKEEKGRIGNVVNLPDTGKVIVAGDLHGNVTGYNRIVNHANLAANPDTHIIFQELIHGGPEDFMGGCLSFMLLREAAALKILYPDNVHFIMANHDMSAICGTDVLRGGKEMSKAFHDGLERCYGEETDMVHLSLRQFLFSQPLAIRAPNGIFVCHSLPADRFEKDFDFAIFDRPLSMNDINRPNSAYLLVWGRNHSEGLLERFADKLGIRLFIVGHQKQDDGWKRVDPNMLILASDDNNGSVVTFDLARRYSLDELCGCISNLIDLYQIKESNGQ